MNKSGDNSILQLGKVSFPSLDATTRFALSWPVEVWTVQLPLPKKVRGEKDNVFEHFLESWLSVTDNPADRTPEAVSKATGIPFDFLVMLFRHLRDVERLDSTNRPREAFVEEKNEVDEDSFEFATAYIFRDRIGGRLLHEVKVLGNGEQLSRSREVFEGWRVPHKVKISDAIRAQPLLKPTEKEVIREFAIMRRRLGESFPAVAEISANRVTINPQPQMFRLYTEADYSQITDDYRVADPFGRGLWSPTLQEAFNLYLQKPESEELRQKLQESSKWHRENKSRSRFSDRARSLYPAVVESLTPRSGEAYLRVQSLYAAMENAFWYYCRERGDDRDIAAELSNVPYDEQTRIFADSARYCGFEIPEADEDSQIKTLPFVLSEEVDLYRRFGQVRWRIVLSIALVMARRDPASQRLSMIARYQQKVKGTDEIVFDGRQFLSMMGEMEEIRKKYSHGAETVGESRSKTKYEDVVLDLVSILLPEIGRVNKDVNLPIGSIGLRQCARLRLTEYYSGVFPSNGIFQKLMSAECFFLDKIQGAEDDIEVDATHGFGDVIAPAIEELLRSAVGRLRIKDHSAEKAIAEARRHLVAFEDVEGAVENELITGENGPRMDIIKKALMGQPSSLGALLVVFLAKSGEKKLRRFATSHRDFVTCMDRVLQWRGHGNFSVKATVKDVRMVRKEAYASIKDFLIQEMEDSVS